MTVHSSSPGRGPWEMGRRAAQGVRSDALHYLSVLPVDLAINAMDVSEALWKIRSLYENLEHLGDCHCNGGVQPFNEVTVLVDRILMPVG